MNTLQTSSTPKNKTKKAGLLVAMTAGLLLMLFISLSVGSSDISVTDAFRDNTAFRILLYVRLPRAVAAVFAGAALAVSGVIIQTVLGNPIAGPSIIGVNSGAGFFALLAAAILPTLPSLVPTFAFTGALLAGLIIFVLASKTGAGKLTVVLAGVAINSILTAGTDTLTVLDTDLVYAKTSFMIGGFSGVSFAKMAPALVYIFIGITVAIIFSAKLNLLLLGENTAKTLGMNVSAVRFFYLCIASLLAGSAVSFSGLLSFVGLLIPHISRRLVGTDNKILLPFCALFGAIFVLFCDTVCRVIFAPFELPVGIVMSLLGGPFFLFLLMRRKENRLW